MLGQALTDLVAGVERLFTGVLADLAQGHFFNERDVQLAVDGEAHQVDQFVVIAALEHHAVELGFLETGAACGVDAGNHLVQVAGAGQLLEAPGVEAVEADVQARDTGVEQWLGQAAQLRAVAGQAQFTQAGQGGDAPAQLDNALAHQRLATGEADLAGAQRDEAFGHLEQFFEAEDLLARQKLHVFGHAVHATEVAAVGDRHPQVVDFPVEAVYEGPAVLFHGRARMGGCQLQTIT
ncbi:hypothetical protein D3C76_606970 [compost metagenome]